MTSASKSLRDNGNVRGYPVLTAEQTRELRFYRNNVGRQWKNKLLIAWRSDCRDVNPILRALRNTHGPVWLSKMQLRVVPVDHAERSNAVVEGVSP